MPSRYIALLTIVICMMLLTGCGGPADTVGIAVEGDTLVIEKDGKKSKPELYTGKTAQDTIEVEGQAIKVTYSYSDNFILSPNNPNQISPDLAQSSGKLKYIGYNFGDNITIFKEEGLDVGTFEAAILLTRDTKGIDFDKIVAKVNDFYKKNPLFKPAEAISYLNLDGIEVLDISGQSILYKNGVFQLPGQGITILRVNSMTPFQDVDNDKVFKKDVITATYKGLPTVIFNSELAVIGVTKTDLENMKRSK